MTVATVTSAARTALLWLLLSFIFVVAARRPIRVNPNVAGRHSTIPGKRDAVVVDHGAPRSHQQYGGAGGHPAKNPYAGSSGHMWGTAHAATGCPQSDVLAVTFESSATSSDGKLYGNLMAYGLLQVKPGDYFEYEYMWAEPDCNCGAEFELGSEFRLRDHAKLDARGFSPHSEKNANMSARATRRWYHRRWDLDDYPSLEKKFIDKWVFSALLRPGERRTAYFKHVRLVRPSDPGSGKKIWEQGMPPISVSSYFPGTITTKCQPIVAVEASEVAVWPPSMLERRPGRTVALSLVLRAEALVADHADDNDEDVANNDAASATPGTANADSEEDATAPTIDPPDSAPSATDDAAEVPAKCETSWSALRALQVLFAEQRIAAGRGRTVLLHGYTARLRHREYPTLTLWDFGQFHPAAMKAASPPTVDGVTLVVLPAPQPLPTPLELRVPLPERFSPLTALLADGVWEVNVTTSSTTGDDASAGPNFQNTTVVVQAFGGSYDPR
uniref:Uncharacterized protein n=1 Tax=Neobodo designis TaxID=312471 RepID=A0A7S1MJD8_NEODS